MNHSSSAPPDPDSSAPTTAPWQQGAADEAATSPPTATSAIDATQVDLGPLADMVFEAVIFDMDGTLIDSTPAVHRSWERWAVEHDIATEHLVYAHGVPAAATVAKLLPAERVDAAVARISHLELTDVEGIVVLPGAAEALAALADAPNAIATSCVRALADARIRAARLVPPTVVVTADQVKHGKPAPDPFLLAAERLGVDPTRCLVVEDAVMGLRSAVAAGCRTLAVVTTTPRAELVADAVIPDLSYVRFEVTPEGVRVRVA